MSVAENVQPRTSPLLSSIVSSSVPGRAVQISLSAPRPDLEREQNEYIQSPLRGPSPENNLDGGGGGAGNHERGRRRIEDSDEDEECTFVLVNIGEQPTLEKSRKNKVQSNHQSGHNHRRHHRRGSWTSKKLDPGNVVTDRPTAASAPSLGSCDWKSDGNGDEQHLSAVDLGSSVSASATLNAAGTVPLPLANDDVLPGNRRSQAAASSAAENVPGGDSIICSRCKRCKCSACAAPRPMPSKWLCGDKCLCSPETTVDYCSCIWLPRCLFYHCVDDEEDVDVEADSDRDDDDGDGHHHHHRQRDRRRRGNFSDDPCGCYPDKWWTRWSCLAVLALPFPCLLCYWPLRGCVSTAQAAYQSLYRLRHSCRCAEVEQRRVRRELEKHRRQRAASVSTSTTTTTTLGPLSQSAVVFPPSLSSRLPVSVPLALQPPPAAAVVPVFSLSRPITPASTRNLRLDVPAATTTAATPPPASSAKNKLSLVRQQVSCSSSTSSRTQLLHETRVAEDKDSASSSSE